MKTKKPMSVARFLLWLLGIPVIGIFIFFTLIIVNIKLINDSQRACGVVDSTQTLTTIQNECLGLALLEEAPSMFIIILALMALLPIGEGIVIWKFITSRKNTGETSANLETTKQ